jgi:signal transduction histidine kinase
VLAVFPDLEWRTESAGASAGFVVREPLAEELNGERGSHTRQYLFEGTFFLGVLTIAMLVLGRFLKQEADLVRRQNNFLAAVSHELKSPLASLRLTNETLSRRSLNDGKRAELAQRNREDLGRLERLISNLLESSRVEQARVVQTSESIPVHQLIDEAISDLALRDSGTTVDLDIEVPEELQIEADPVAARTVVRNLLQNAVEACRVAQVQARIGIHADRNGKLVRLRVLDNGIGFAAEEAERLFEKFYRTGDELTRNKQGTGLGLYLVKRFVELDGGLVKAESGGEGTGACFEVDWPTAETPRRGQHE